MSEKRIHSSLGDLFHTNRIVFWYDSEKEWKDGFDSFSQDDVEKLELNGNEFGSKIKILSHPDTKFLVYSSSPRPADADNWLLDLLLQGHEFKADRASLAVQEAGLPYEFRSFVDQHIAFFRSGKRIEAFKDLITKDDDIPELRLKLMAVTANTEADIDAILLQFLEALAKEPLIDPAAHTLDPFELTSHFWKEVNRLFGYDSQEPGTKDFLFAFFKGASPIHTEDRLNTHGKLFLQRWKDSHSRNESFVEWSRQLEEDLQIASQLDRLESFEPLLMEDTFEILEKFIIHRLCQDFENEKPTDDLLKAIQLRRQSFWHDKHQHAYIALEKAVKLRDRIQSIDISIESIDQGIKKYVDSWWQIDQEYRQCAHSIRRYGEVNVMSGISDWLEKTYVNSFLLPLSDRWSDKVKALTSWRCSDFPEQKTFFERFAQPFLKKKQKVFVVISDALRYEAAREFAKLIESENRWTAESNAMFGTLPSFTQLGMASLLPGKELSMDNEGNVSVDGISASGTENRKRILQASLGERSYAIQAESFLALNTKDEGRALARDHDTIFVYHNRIDKVGDTRDTEANTFEAVEQAFSELKEIMKKISNINGTNALLVADHGFLYQQEPVHEDDSCPLPKAARLSNKNRRFVIGNGIEEDSSVKVFTSTELGLKGEWEAAFPISLGRFPLRGSGKRYVHGGPSLQEVVIPVIRLHKARKDDVRRVNVDLMQVPAKITTGQVAFSLYQDNPVSSKLLARKLRVGVFANDGTALSEVRTLDFDSSETESRKREVSVILSLGTQSNDYNNQDVEIRLEEIEPGTTQKFTYKSHPIRMQKPFDSDFDEF